MSAAGVRGDGATTSAGAGETVSSAPWAQTDWLAVVVLVIVAAVLRLWKLSANGYGNPYYGATVRSMGASWHNFFFASFDPRGYLSLDKPPVAFWLQAADAHLFGFHPFALLFPSAVAGIGAVVLLYCAVRRVFGSVSAAVTACALALMPITVATDRFNDPDALLAFLLVLTSWLVVRATEDASWRRLVIGGAVMGLAFETKSLAAIIPLPGLGLAYLIGARTTMRARLTHLIAAACALAIVGLSWVAVVDAVPATTRPLVGGSTRNSEIDLIFGSNGIARLSADPSASVPTKVSASKVKGPAPNPHYGDQGKAGLLRLVQSPLGGQAGWLLAVDIAGVVSCLLELPRRQGDRRFAFLVMWTVWLAAEAVVLSAAQGLFHAYYLTAMVPASAAVAGIGAPALVRAWKSRRWPAVLVPAALVCTGIIESQALAGYASYRAEGVLCLLMCALAAGLLILAMRREALRRTAAMFFGAAVVVSLLAPLAWTLSVLRHPGSAPSPVAGPPLDPGAALLAKETVQAKKRHQPLSVIDSETSPGGEIVGQLIAFARANDHNERWVLAMPTGLDAAPVIIRSGLGVIPLGGINGAPVMTVSQLADLIGHHQVRFVLLNLPLPTAASLLRVEQWVQQHCAVVPQADYRPTDQTSGPTEMRDCAPGTAPVNAA